jgi:hypothetical protein
MFLLRKTWKTLVFLSWVMIRMFLQTFFCWHNHFVQHSIMPHPSIPSPTVTPNVTHPKTLNIRLYSPFTAFILKMRAEVYTKYLCNSKTWLNPQRDGIHKTTKTCRWELWTMRYHEWLSLSWWNILLPSLTLDAESVNSTETQLTTYQTVRCHNTDY